MSYSYSQGDRLNDRNTYFYSEFRGSAFLEAWRASRESALAVLPAPVCMQLPAARGVAGSGGYHTSQVLVDLLNNRAEPLLDRLLQRFEVSKRLYREYDDDFKAIRETGYDDLELYLLFGELCVHSQRRPAATRFLNALLKVVDSLISVLERLRPEQGARLAWLIGRERAWVQRVAAGLDIDVEFDMEVGL